MVDAMRSVAPGFIFTTSMPPAQAAGAREEGGGGRDAAAAATGAFVPLWCAVAAVRHLKSSAAERVLLHTRSAHFKRLLLGAGFPLLPSVSHIVPVWVGSAAKAKAASDALLRRFGLYVQVRARGEGRCVQWWGMRATLR